MPPPACRKTPGGLPWRLETEDPPTRVAIPALVRATPWWGPPSRWRLGAERNLAGALRRNAQASPSGLGEVQGGSDQLRSSGFQASGQPLRNDANETTETTLLPTRKQRATQYRGGQQVRGKWATLFRVTARFSSDVSASLLASHSVGWADNSRTRQPLPQGGTVPPELATRAAHTGLLPIGPRPGSAPPRIAEWLTVAVRSIACVELAVLGDRIACGVESSDDVFERSRFVVEADG
jgi:hypothetical protein